jgi:membrane-associated protein
MAPRGVAVVDVGHDGTVGFVERLLDFIAEIGLPGLYFVTAGLAFAECALFLDFIVPGETGMVVAGAAGARAGASLPLLIGAAALGATLGDSASYALGRYVGMPLICRWEWARKRLEPKIERGREYFHSRGGAAVFFGRFVGIVRGVVPFVAGTALMPYRRFLAWNVAASICWTGLVLSAGFLLGRNIETLVDNIALVVSIVIVVGFVGWLIYRRVKRARAGAASN